jgi:hypothetical protein
VTDTPPPADEEDLVAVAAERETLEGFLEYHRRVLGGKLRGLSEEDARRRLVPSATTLLGLVSHAAPWSGILAPALPGRQAARGDRRERPRRRPELGRGSRQDHRRRHRRVRERLRGIPADRSGLLAGPDRAARPAGPVSLRWIYVHIIREHARHVGHADILREQIDGATGDSRGSLQQALRSLAESGPARRPGPGAAMLAGCPASRRSRALSAAFPPPDRRRPAGLSRRPSGERRQLPGLLSARRLSTRTLASAARRSSAERSSGLRRSSAAARLRWLTSVYESARAGRGSRRRRARR